MAGQRAAGRPARKTGGRAAGGVNESPAAGIRLCSVMLDQDGMRCAAAHTPGTACMPSPPGPRRQNTHDRSHLRARAYTALESAAAPAEGHVDTKDVREASTLALLKRHALRRTVKIRRGDAGLATAAAGRSHDGSALRFPRNARPRGQLRGGRWALISDIPVLQRKCRDRTRVFVLVPPPPPPESHLAGPRGRRSRKGHQRGVGLRGRPEVVWPVWVHYNM